MKARRRARPADLRQRLPPADLVVADMMRRPDWPEMLAKLTALIDDHGLGGVTAEQIKIYARARGIAAPE